MDEPIAVQALRQLERLAGEWTFEATWPLGEPWPGGRRVAFEWYASRGNLVERGPAEVPEAPDDVCITASDGRQP